MTQPSPGDDRRYQQQPPLPPTGAYAQQPPPNWGPQPPGQPQKPPKIQDQLRRGLATTRGKLIAIALVVAAIVTTTVVAVVGSKVAFADDSQAFDLGEGVHITVSVPDGWKAELTSNSDREFVVMQPEDTTLSASDARAGSSDLVNDNPPQFDITAVILQVASCSERAANSLEEDGLSRRGAWMVSEALPSKVDDYRMRIRTAFRTGESCSGYTVGAAGIEGDRTGEAGTAATDLVSQIADDQIITNIEIK